MTDPKITALTEYIDWLAAHFITADAAIYDSLEGVNKQEIRAIRYIGHHEPCIMREIASAMGLVSSAATAIIDKLVAKELVYRFKTEADRRLVKVALTEAGQAVYTKAQQAYWSMSQGMLSQLAPAEQEQLLALLDKITSRIKAADSSQPPP